MAHNIYLKALKDLILLDMVEHATGDTGRQTSVNPRTAFET